MERKNIVSIKTYNYDVRDNHAGGSTEIQTAVVGGPDQDVVGRGAATIKQRVAEKFRGEEDAGYLPWHITESAYQEHSAASQGRRFDVLQVPGHSEAVGRWRNFQTRLPWKSLSNFSRS